MAGGTATAITVSGTQIAGGAVAAGIGIAFFSQNANRYKPKDSRSNKSQNDKIDYYQSKYGFDKDFRRRLHDKITRKGYSDNFVEELIRKWLGIE